MQTANNHGGGVIIDVPVHYCIPNEEGYFPAGSSDSTDPLLAQGTLTLCDPDAGTADDIALVGRCGDALFYVMVDDAATKATTAATTTPAHYIIESCPYPIGVTIIIAIMLQQQKQQQQQQQQQQQCLPPVSITRIVYQHFMQCQS